MSEEPQGAHWLRNSAVVVAIIAALGTTVAAMGPRFFSFDDSRCRVVAADIVRLNESIHDFLSETMREYDQTYAEFRTLSQMLGDQFARNMELRAALADVRNGLKMPTDASLDELLRSQSAPQPLPAQQLPTKSMERLSAEMRRLIAACP